MSHAFKSHDLPKLALNFRVGVSRMLYYNCEKGAKNLLDHCLHECGLLCSISTLSLFLFDRRCFLLQLGISSFSADGFSVHCRRPCVCFMILAMAMATGASVNEPLTLLT